MNSKSLGSSAVIAIVFFGLGMYFGGEPAAPAPADEPVPAQSPSKTIDSLSAENAQLRSVVDRVTTTNAELITRISIPAPAPAPPPAPVVSAPVAAPQPATQQRAVLNNLRQLGAAVDQFRLENGRYPTSIAEIVGPNAYIKQLISVAGEDYNTLNLTGDLVITIPEGPTITYKQ